MQTSMTPEDSAIVSQALRDNRQWAWKLFNDEMREADTMLALSFAQYPGETRPAQKAELMRRYGESFYRQTWSHRIASCRYAIRLTVESVRDAVRGWGFTIRKRDGEFLVRPKGARGEDSTYFTNDLQDALETARVRRAEVRA